jgi:anti-sigma factor RsiW
MNHAEATQLMGPYRDGELDLASCLKLEEHLAGCPSCQESLEAAQELASLLQAEAPRFRPPPSLQGRIRAMLREERGSSAAVPWWKRFSLPALHPGLAGALAATFILAAGFAGMQGTSSLDGEAVADHVRSLQAAHLLDVASTDQHTVKPWFAGKLDYSPQVVDLAPSGYPLVGGRLDVLDRRNVAALVYQRRKHYINLFVWPSDRGSLHGSHHSRNGYHVLGWTRAGMNYLAVSELGEGELKEFVEMIQARTLDSQKPE